ncbi:protein phosphatase 2C domain-containing protein [Micromonospora sp. WMMD714]|uniref:protein phosphatase 2C domain-containing protein n=1 Tax=Micromonospora sp. WMMD714 TaxID=3016097 RepID=UPI00249CA8E9|nr:protein phosphatase 2C domain-containing protein [Micromonospora sp. WMMD714]WFE62414.1 protein phosphatase 2C domain-containing protein [Micromonospora sp. WMMD714]
MSATNPRPEVVTAERPGRDRPTEDRIFTTSNAVIVLDGASQPEASTRDGGWLAEQVGRHLQQLLTEHPAADLADTLAETIRHVRDLHGLRPDASPSTTASIVRWFGNDVDILVLGDSPTVLLTRTGEIHEVRDDRLSRVAPDQRADLREAVRQRGGFGFHHAAEWAALVDAQRRARNSPGGYWIVEAEPEAARHAVRASWPISELAAGLTVTDGVADGVNDYRTPATWRAAIVLANQHPARLVETVHQAEKEDADGRRWPRSKRHDDKAVALVRLTTAAHIAKLTS